ncbi:MAG: hypothetical protein EOP05_14215 [Proteobacteria bacterium]|nr:MAG: hypothetical protein EOP05_14215 [Pseudomonadota bacterium]
MRVLKAGGFHGVLDSLQKGDEKDFDVALEMFPKEFHEPFYKNYIENPMEKLIEGEGMPVQNVNIGFFSKSVSSVKDAKVEAKH